MTIARTLRRVLANLREGRPADAVRTDEPVGASAAFQRRMRATADTDAFVDRLLPALPPALHPVLRSATVVHGDVALTSLADVAARVAQHRGNLLTVLDRGGMPVTSAQQAELDGLAELLRRLPALAEPGAAGETPTATR